MTNLEPDTLADRIEREIRDGAFILLGPAEVALCVEALRRTAALEQEPVHPKLTDLLDSYGVRPVHPKLAEVLESYGCTGTVTEADK